MAGFVRLPLATKFISSPGWDSSQPGVCLLVVWALPRAGGTALLCALPVIARCRRLLTAGRRQFIIQQVASAFSSSVSSLLLCNHAPARSPPRLPLSKSPPKSSGPPSGPSDVDVGWGDSVGSGSAWGVSSRVGTALAVATIPVSLGVFAWQLLPYVIRRYCLTSRRIVIQKGLSRQEEAAIGLDEFDSIEIQRLPGQQWLRCGDMLFLRDGREVFRLAGVPRPETFREVCLKQQMTVATIGRVLRQQEAAAAPVTSPT